MENVLLMLLALVLIPVFIWAGMVVLGSLGYFKILRHEEVDVNFKVKTWEDTKVSKKAQNGDCTGPRFETTIEFPFTELLFPSMLNKQ
eukprot:10767005-Ditylum_brightwellii.AAC.1